MSSHSTLAPGLKQRHVTMLEKPRYRCRPFHRIGVMQLQRLAQRPSWPTSCPAHWLCWSCACSVKWQLLPLIPVRFPPMPERAMGSFGRFYHWMVVLVVLGAGHSHRGNCRQRQSCMPGSPRSKPGIRTGRYCPAHLDQLVLALGGATGSSSSRPAMLKVIAVLAFIALGALALTGVVPNLSVSGVAKLSNDSAVSPNGMGMVIGAMLTTVFSFMGTEIVTIAAAESKDPSRQITRATNSVVWRMGIFYIVSVFLIVSIVPWNDPMLVQVGSHRGPLS